MKNKLKHFIYTILILTLAFSFSISANAEEVAEPATDDTAEVNVFTGIYAEVTEYAGEILCALTFVGSVVLAIAYKTGLLPIVKGSLVSLGNAVNKIKDNATENAEKGALLGKSIEDSLSDAKNALDGVINRVDALEAAIKGNLKEADEAEREKTAFRLILNSQVDMLYEIFMSSALPQYQKDAVGERVAKMKEALAENGKTE